MAAETRSSSSVLPRSGNTDALHRSGPPRTGQPVLKAVNNPGMNRNALRERRRTLQTISELSPHDATEWNDPLPKERSNVPTGPTLSSISVKRDRRRSLPIQATSSRHELRTTPSILVTPTDAPTLYRSLTDPSNRRRDSSRQSGQDFELSTRSNPNRLSASSFVCCRHSQDPPLFSIAEGTQADVRRLKYTVGYPTPYFKQNETRTKQSIQSANGQTRHSGDWNARREQERVNREQAIIAAKARREEEGHIDGRSPSALPSLPPFSTAKAKETHIKRQGSQKQFFPHAQHINDSYTQDLLNRRASYGRITGHVNGNQNVRLTPKRASTSGHHPSIHQHGVLHRSHTVASEPSRTCHADLAVLAMPQLGRASSSQSLAPSTSQGRYRSNRTKSNSSLTPSPISASSSSIQSNPSGVSNGITQTPRLYLSSVPRYCDKQQISKGRLEAFPTLPDIPSLDAPSALTSHPANPNAKPRRYSQSSQRSRRSSLTQGPSRPQSQHDSQPSMPELKATNDTSGIIHRENPDKQGLLRVVSMPQDMTLLQKREKMLQSKAEKEKLELEKMTREKAREKVKERVRRANELEEEKEKALVKVEQKKRRRNLFCGLFGD
ncbi:hypothetical protein K458DRAFT_413864 [Lentithecium fluviatile CBS 122367]|uniref:Uncharacterized protein n=1 Tax=Lentithecium fluviatile CBS 122367 TaxID=1168545 RepID=A0A6G1JHE2_9PLEO|nr:hypothetical protein K458DRAFT_413864 [Lentithecium fluviatile CBS 122367]